MYNLKEAADFDGKFSFNSVVMFENLLSNIAIKIDTSLIVFQ